MSERDGEGDVEGRPGVEASSVRSSGRIGALLESSGSTGVCGGGGGDVSTEGASPSRTAAGSGD